MLTVFDVHLELQAAASVGELVMLRNHFKALAIDAIGLDRDDFKPRTDELKFSIYGNVGPFMMRQMVQECTQNVFPGSVIESLSSR